MVTKSYIVPRFYTSATSTKPPTLPKVKAEAVVTIRLGDVIRMKMTVNG